MRNWIAITVLLFTLIIFNSSYSQDNADSGTPPSGKTNRTTEPLWPGIPPLSTLQGDGDVPKLIITKVASPKPTAAVVILPGGGYSGHAMDHEGYQIAEWFHALGVASAICTYRLRGKGNDGKGYGHPVPMLRRGARPELRYRQ